ERLATLGWVGHRAQTALCSGKWSPPEWPGRVWEDVAPPEFKPSPQQWIEEQVLAHNQAFEAKQLVERRTFFDKVEKQPLTEEQAKAVICMDDEQLVVVAAGSGKSSTIGAKAGYAIQEKVCAPEE